MKYIFILLTLLFTSCNTLKIQVQVGPVGKPCKTYINTSNKVTPANFLFTDQLTFYSVVEFSKDGEKFKKEFDNCKNLSDAYEQVRKYVEKVCK